MLTKQTFRLVSLASVKLKTVPSIPSISKRSLYYISTRTSPITITNQHDTRVQYPKASIQSAHRFYCDSHPKEINFKVSKSKELIKDAIQTKRTNLLMKKNVFVKDLRERKSRVQEQVQERKDVLVKDFREKKMKVQDKVQEKVRVMEEIVERENIFTIPNLLCVGRGVLAPIVGYAIIEQHFMLSMGLLAFAGLTDLADGFIARTWPSQASKIGSFLDPMADKLLVGALVISLSYCGLFPVWLSAMVICRDAFLIGAGFVIRYISLPKPRTLGRYFDATHATAKLEPTFISKMNTGVQLFAIGTSLGAPIWAYVDHSALHGLWYVTGATTLAAALSYILQKDTYKIIKQNLKRKN